MTAALCWRCRDRTLNVGPAPLIMGILNVTPDSFADGGRHMDTGAALAHAEAMVAAGADIIDVGGESSRPGAQAVPVDIERARVIPVIRALGTHSRLVVSVDTRKATIAREAIECGARIINDISGLTHDPAMVPLAAATGVGVVLMHMRGEPATMQAAPRYADVVAEVGVWLGARMRAAVAAGIAREALALDPGIGFGKTVAHNLRLIAGLRQLRRFRRPVMLGLSRKSFLGAITGREVHARVPASLAALAIGVWQGAGILRVHDVAESRDAGLLAAALLAVAPRQHTAKPEAADVV